jgi:energy-coupling factor transporter ATP-binding protein EcfA2
MALDIPALSMRSLCKNFDGKPAVSELELTIQPGEFYALLGPNGAGKTTTIRMAAGLLLPDSGSIEIFGVDVVREPVAAKRMTAWLPDEPALYDKLDPLEYLEFVAGLAAQITSTIIASAMILGGQLAYLATGPTQATKALVQKLPDAPVFAQWLIDAPVRGVAGDMLALSLWMALGVIAFALAVLYFGPGFLEGAILVKGAGDRQPVLRQKAVRPFRAGAGAALRRKELKLLGRDPWLFSRALLQLLYIAPVCIVIWISRDEPSLSLLVAPVLIMVLSHLAGILAWLTILNEDAVDFMTTAPVTQDAILRSKLHAVALPLGFILLGPALALAWSEPFNALLTVIFATAACISTALVNIWHPAPGKLEAATSRHNPPKIVALKENMLSVFWAVACATAISEDNSWSRYALAALVFVWFNRPRQKTKGARRKALA